MKFEKQQSPFILDLYLRKAREEKSLYYQHSSFFKCFPSTRKRKADLFKFIVIMTSAQTLYVTKISLKGFKEATSGKRPLRPNGVFHKNADCYLELLSIDKTDCLKAIRHISS